MNRITPVQLGDMPMRTRELIERVPFYREAPRHLFSYTARHDGHFPAWFRFTMTLLNRGELTARQRELAVVRTALHSDSEYELAQHVDLARDAGVTAPEFASLISDAALFSGTEVDLIAFVDEMALRGDVSDTTWARLAHDFNEVQMIELSMVVAYYQALAALLRVLQVPLEPGMTDPR